MVFSPGNVEEGVLHLGTIKGVGLNCINWFLLGVTSCLMERNTHPIVVLDFVFFHNSGDLLISFELPDAPLFVRRPRRDRSLETLGERLVDTRSLVKDCLE